MHRIFIPIYKFFERRRWLMWTVLILSSIVFIVFGLKISYEEDISKLLPQSEAAEQSGLAFGNLKVKDKIFIQIHGKDGDLDPHVLADYSREFTDSLMLRDTATGYISGILNGIGDDMMFMALDYALTNLPTLVDTACYPIFDEMITREAIASTMKANAEMVYNDMEGSISTMVGYDPANLRSVILSQALGSASSGNGSSGSEAGETSARPSGSGAGEASARPSVPGGYALVDGMIFCPDSTVALAFLSPNFNSLDSKAGGKLVKMIEKEVDTFEAAHPDAEILFHGNPVQSVFNSRQIKKDLAMTVSVSMILICLLIAYCFKNKSTLPMLLAPVVYGAFFALACVFWIKGGMSLMAIGIGALVLGVALSYCLHVLTHFKYVSDPVQVIKDQSTPVILGCITTIGAFMGLLFTQSDLLRDFGIFASLAMVGTTLFALVFTPHFFKPERNRRSERAFLWINKISNYPLDQKKWLLVLVTLVCVVCCFTQSMVKFDSNLRHIGYNEPKVVASQQLYAQKNNGGYSSMYYAASAPTLDQALECNKAILATLDGLREDGIIARYSSLAALFPTTEDQQERIDAWESYWSSGRLDRTRGYITSAATAEGLSPDMFESFYLMAESDYSPASLYDAGVLPDELLCNYIEETSDGHFMVFTSVLMDEDHKKAVSDAVASNPGAVVIDPFYYTNDMVEILNNDFNVILNISSIFVFIVLLISFRSLAIALISFLPMFLSWFVVKGVMGIFGIEFNLINIIIATFIFGIGVDYSIFVMKGLLSRASGQDTKLLMYHKAAIFFSAVTLIVVVVSLLFATHPAIRSIGFSTLVGMTSTILITYTLQPFLFRQLLKIKYFRKRYGPRELPSDTSASGSDSKDPQVKE